MAKKKNRTANVARKREKRNRDRKSRHKQLAVEKQRRHPYGKMDEERFHTCLVRSRDLLEETELEGLHFDPDLMFDEVVQFLRDNEIQYSPQDSDVICDRFREDVLPRLITPRFKRTLLAALTACENRLRRTGDRDLAEVAFVTQLLFEVAPPDIFGEHPLIQGICMQTLCLLVEQPPAANAEHPAVSSVLSDVLETENATDQQKETLPNMFSDAIAKESTFANGESQLIDTSDILPVPTVPEPEASHPIPSPDSLPAKVLYKNFEGLAIKEVLKRWQGPTLEKETATQLDYFDAEQELYITVTESRVQLHAHSDAELTVAMEALEVHCQSALMYLAKTYEEGGNTDGTE